MISKLDYLYFPKFPLLLRQDVCLVGNFKVDSQMRRVKMNISLSANKI